jgi:6-phosphogluconolactonase
MKPIRLVFSLILGVFFAAISLGDSPPPSQKFLVFVGTYTDKTDSKGIYAYEFDTATGKLTPRGLAAETPNPSWVTIHPNGKFLYAANESGKQSTITAFSLNGDTGVFGRQKVELYDPTKLTLLNQLPALGEDPCYLSFDKTGKFLFVANYTSGNVVVFPILPDGKLGPATANVKDTGTLGPNKERQEAPHAHWVQVSGDNRFAYVSDLGLDALLVYRFDPSYANFEGSMLGDAKGPSAELPASTNRLILSPGTGPRHAAFLANGDFMYVLGELQSTVTVFKNRYEPGSSIRQISALPMGYSGRNDAAEIAIHPNGKWLFVSNRGHDSIAVFAIDPQKGTLTPAGHYPTGGKEPRHFAIDPTGQFLLAENQNSNSVVTFRINQATGGLAQVSVLEGVPSPVCLVFLANP